MDGLGTRTQGRLQTQPARSHAHLCERCHGKVSRSNNNTGYLVMKANPGDNFNIKMIRHLYRPLRLRCRSTGGAEGQAIMETQPGSPVVRRLTIAAIAVAALSTESTALSAQRRPVTRDALEAAAKSADAARHPDVANRLRERLREGDFQPGHRIVLMVEGDSTLTDTFTVRADRKLLLPNLPLISLAGVLESELDPYLEKELSKYIRNPTVRAEPLLQVSVLGSVGRPGFYSVPTDVTLGDAIMQAGGPSPTSDVRKIEIRRGKTTAISKGEVQEAIRLGETLGDLGVRPGDELWVPDKSSTNWTRVITIVSTAATLGYTLSWALRR